MDEMTNGPWAFTDTFNEDGYGWVWQVRCGDYYGKPVADLIQSEETACLIAAAPDLLRVCLLIAENAPLVAEWIKENDPPAWTQIQAAIAKATTPNPAAAHSPTINEP